jgi:alpha,alpha-trehalose phosphorylase
VRSGLHIASLGGSVVAAICGFGGVRDHDHHLLFAPRLPEHLSRLTFPIIYRGRRLVVEVTPATTTYTLDEGDEPLEIAHWGEALTLQAATPQHRQNPPVPDLPEPPQPLHRGPARARAADRLA